MHTLETSDVPADHRAFVLDTENLPLSRASFDDGWTTTRDEAGGPIHWPVRQGATVTISDVGDWDGGRVDLRLSLVAYNGGNIGQLNHFDASGNVVSDGTLWINTDWGDTAPQATRAGLGDVDTTKRVGCTWKATFVRPDGTPLPDTFKGVTGFNDLDGWDPIPSWAFEGVRLGDGFDGAYLLKDAEIATYGVNGFAGWKRDSGSESDPDGAVQSRHRLSATWSGPSFTFSYELNNPPGRQAGSHMTFGAPVTLLHPLVYDPNGGTGNVPGR